MKAIEKPKWWPDNPYPKSVFPMERDKYSEVVPDEKTRTALSGMLGREFWEIASDTIWEAVEAELSQVRELLKVAKCPNSCIDGSIPHRIVRGWEQEQCQWCYERKQALDLMGGKK